MLKFLIIFFTNLTDESSKCVLAPKDDNLNNLSDDFLKLDKNKLTRAMNCLRLQDLIKFTTDNDIKVEECFEV